MSSQIRSRTRVDRVCQRLWTDDIFLSFYAVSCSFPLLASRYAVAICEKNSLKHTSEAGLLTIPSTYVYPAFDVQ